MLKIAVTGGIACGKSLVGSFLADNGIPVCEADELARKLLQPGRAAYDETVERFGKDMVGSDGHIDREKLGRRVFADESDRQALNAILHPRVRDAWGEWMGKQLEGTSAVAVIVPLLYEAGLEQGWNHIVCVTAGKRSQLERLARRGLDAAEAGRRMAAQWDTSRKASLAEFVVVNNGTKVILQEQVTRVLNRILERVNYATEK